MTHPVLGIDHTYLLVQDLDASAALYRQLGFTLSPRGLHSPQKGTANHTIVFKDDYVELLGIVNATDLNRSQRASLAEHGEGLQAIANRTLSADAAKPALAARGIATGDVSAFSRPLPLADGKEGIASFRTLSFDVDEVPIGHFFLCQHETPEMVWRQELQQHPNGAMELGGIVAIVDEPRHMAEIYTRFYAAGRVTEAEGGFRVYTGTNSAPLQFVDLPAARTLFPGQEIEQGKANRFAALRIVVDDVERTRRHLVDHGVAFNPTPGGGISVGSRQASGAIIEFLAG
jgi:catechol 2,3-dioxygenase-like lactoylglutathione lyase family enzyme